MEFTNEQIEKAKKCKTLEEFKELAKAEGLNFSDEEAKTYFGATHVGELSDDDLSSVAGGKGGQWVENFDRYHHTKCPFCGLERDLRVYHRVHTKTKAEYYRTDPGTCPCGAVIRHFAPVINWCEYHKDGRTLFDR